MLSDEVDAKSMGNNSTMLNGMNHPIVATVRIVFGLWGKLTRQEHMVGSFSQRDIV